MASISLAKRPRRFRSTLEARLGMVPQMKIVADAVVSIEYTLKDDEGTVLDERTGESLAYLHGHHNIVPGLEKALEGKEAGASVEVSLEPEEGYGPHDPAKVMKVGKAQLASDLEPEVGMMLHAEGPDGPVPLWISDVAEDFVMVDGNHPLAGKRLHFRVQVSEVRSASEEEISHGHVHGPGGRHH